MKKELRVSLIFGLAQLLLSIGVLGSFEYSILSGDMAQSSEASFWTFVIGSRLIYYIGFSVVNLILFALFSTKFSSLFHPGITGAVVMAASTVVLVVPLLLSPTFRVPYPLVAPIAFLIVAVIYGAILRAMANNGGGKS